MMDSPGNERTVIDNEHLRMLRLAYFVSAAVAGFYALLGLLYVVFGFTVGSFAESIPSTPGQPPFDSTFPHTFFIVFGFAFALVGAGVVCLRLYAAKCIRLRKSLWVCHLAAAISCLEMPWGTALGVVTFIVLSRDSVRAMFEGSH